jgi:hypothetical protein
MAISPTSIPDEFDSGTAGDRFEGVGLPDALIAELRPLVRLLARQAARQATHREADSATPNGLEIAS